MEQLEAGRVLMGDSLGFHIIFALLGVGLPLAISIFEFIAIRRKDNALRETVRLWSHITGILAVIGVLSGTIVAMQMFFVWPGVIDFGGKVISPAFMLEGYAFMIEAVFLAFYLKTWQRIKGYKHWLLSLPIIAGSTASAFFITSVDAWMNHPTGFNYVNGQIVNAQPWHAIFSTTSLIQSGHSILTYYMTTLFAIMSVYAWVLLRNKKFKVGNAKLASFILHRSAIIGLCMLVAVAVMGDVSGKYLAENEPTKLAAIELRDTTTANAPLILGGTAQADGSAKGGIVIPGALSLLAGNSTSTVVKGLDQTPSHLWPSLVVHTLFDIKMLLVGILVLIPVAFLYGYYKINNFLTNKWVLRTLVLLPFISLTTLELGWVMTEMGRQPYAVHGYVLTSEAMTKSQGVIQLGWVFPAAFLLLFVLTAIAVRLAIVRYKPNLERN